MEKVANLDNNALKVFRAKKEFSELGSQGLALFALQLRFGIEDPLSVMATSIVDGGDDKGIDLIYIDKESQIAVVCQTYLAEDESKKEAVAKKVGQLNHGIVWLLNRAIDKDFPQRLKSHANELREAIENKEIKELYLWYVHNLPKSHNIAKELKTAEHSAKNSLNSITYGNLVQVQATEIDRDTLNQWYNSIQTPILVSDTLSIEIDDGFGVKGSGWEAYITSIPGEWLFKLFKAYGKDLFSANIRDYLGLRRSSDQDINNNIQQTAVSQPKNFWIFNNGITFLVNDFIIKKSENKTTLKLAGLSIINGAQTTGAIGNLKDMDKNVSIQARFVKCEDSGLIYSIVKYNNSQNKIDVADFKSNDLIQRRLHEEFKKIPAIKYIPRRGGEEDVMKREGDYLSSIVASQALAAFRGDPYIAYHKKTKIWSDDNLYSRFFNEHTTAKHIFLAYSLVKAVQKKKLDLMKRARNNSLRSNEAKQLDFFQNRGSHILLVSAIARCMEVFTNRIIPIPNLARIEFRKSSLSLKKPLHIGIL